MNFDHTKAAEFSQLINYKNQIKNLIYMEQTN